MSQHSPVPATVLLFDFDGTLVDSTPAVKFCLQLACEHLQLAQPEPATLDAAIAKGLLMGDIFQLLHPAASGPEIERMVQAYRDAYHAHGLDHSALFPGVIDLLRLLRRGHYRMAIVSNKSEASIHLALQHYQLADYFEQVWGEQSDLPGKPSPELFLQRIAPCYADTPRQDFLMIGDTVADRDFALSSGIGFGLVEYGYGEVELPADGQVFRLRHITDLVAHLPPPAG